MVQIQSTWFLLVARKPQKFLPDYGRTTEADLQKVTERVYHNDVHRLRIVVPLIRAFAYGDYDNPEALAQNPCARTGRADLSCPGSKCFGSVSLRPVDH